jgi:aspartate carbamoyltransferase
VSTIVVMSVAERPTLALQTLTADRASWKGASLLSVNQITSDGLELLFGVTQQMRTIVRTVGGDDSLKNTVLGTVFFEASTRTSCSFQAAAVRLGGRTLHIDAHGGNTSAAKKGESLEDTCRCLECYADILVLRHPVEGSVKSVFAITNKPIINAGDGIGEHPTQALLDIFTIYDELKVTGNDTGALSLTIVLLGDLKNGRTVHSLAKLLCTCGIWGKMVTIRYCSPPGLEMPDYVTEYCDSFPNHVFQETHIDLKTACEGANVLYVTRIQGERFESADAYERVKVSL